MTVAPTTPTAPTPSTPQNPSAAVQALNASRAANVANGVSAYAGSDANLSTFTAANPNVPTIPTTPAVISSKDSAAGFASNQTALTKAQTPITPPTTATTTTSTTPTTTASNGFTTDINGTAVEKGAAAGAGTSSTPNISSGDPIYDSLQSWEADQQAKNEAQAASDKAQVQQMLQTNLANTNAGFAAQMSGITSSYQSLIDTQTQINNQNNARVKAYGLGSGDAMSTPVEFTYAVSNEEQQGIASIQKLDDARDAAISQALSGEQNADAKLLSDSMASIQTIEKDMQDQATNLQSLVDSRYATLSKIQQDQQAQLKTAQTSLLASAVTSFGQQYADSSNNPTAQDALIKQIVTQSGGMLDYGTVFGSLSANAATLTKATQDAETLNADLKLKGAQTTAAYANANQSNAAAAKDEASSNTDAVFSAIDQRLQPGIVMTDPTTGKARTDGGTYLDANGYMTKDGFTQLSQAAAENGENMQSFLKQYGGYLNPNALSDYGLSKADQDSLTDTNKTTPIVLPAGTTVTQSS